MTTPKIATQQEQNFRNEMKRLRTEQGMTQAQFAARMRERGWDDFTQAVVSRLENGQRPITLVESRAVADALNTSTEKMLTPVAEDYITKAVEARVKEFRQNKKELRKAIYYFTFSRDTFFFHEPELSRADQEKMFLELAKNIEEIKESTMWNILVSEFADDFAEMTAQNQQQDTTLAEWVQDGLGIMPDPNFKDWVTLEAQERLEALEAESESAGE